MIVEKLVYDVREALKKYSDDSELDDRRIIYLYDVKRAKYIRQAINNTMRPIDISVKQNLCLSLEVVSALECGLDIGCKELVRTTRPIPTPLQLHDRTAITRVGPIDRIGKRFNFITRDRAVNVVNAPYPNAIYAFLHTDDHIYFVSGNKNTNLLSCVSVEGVFEHPLDLVNYSTCCGCDDAQPCFDLLTSDYPIQPHYIDIIRTEIIEELANLDKIQEDQVNNSTDD